MKKGLEKLGFAVGDDLRRVKEVTWEKEGFKWLEWERVLNAHSQYKKEVCAGVV